MTLAGMHKSILIDMTSSWKFIESSCFDLADSVSTRPRVTPQRMVQLGFSQ